MRHLRRNADPQHRSLERRVRAGWGSPDDSAALARQRQRRGEQVDPWELQPVGHIFYDAYLDLAHYYEPGSIGHGGHGKPVPKDATGRVEAQRMYLDQGDLFGAPKVQRFYVAPSSFPTIGTDELPYYSTPDREDENAWHMKAIEEWRRAGAIVVRLHFDITDHLKVHATQPGHAETMDAEGKCAHCRWIDAYQWRVLTAENRLGSALNQSGHAGGHTVHYVLLPQDWKWARIMRKRKGRWKNNPRRNADRGLRGRERAASAGDPDAERRHLVHLTRAGKLPLLQEPIFLRLLAPGYASHPSGRGLMELPEESRAFNAVNAMEFEEFGTRALVELLPHASRTAKFVSLEVMGQDGIWRIVEGPRTTDEKGTTHSTLYMYGADERHGAIDPNALRWSARKAWPAAVNTAARNSGTVAGHFYERHAVEESYGYPGPPRRRTVGYRWIPVTVQWRGTTPNELIASPRGWDEWEEYTEDPDIVPLDREPTPGERAEFEGVWFRDAQVPGVHPRDLIP